jgi:UbiD family decarboxylase
VVKCETNDLEVPANAEIVFEGHISITELVDEGPFGEMHGYLWKGASQKFPLFTVCRLSLCSPTLLSSPISPAEFLKTSKARNISTIYNLDNFLLS